MVQNVESINVLHVMIIFIRILSMVIEIMVIMISMVVSCDDDEEHLSLSISHWPVVMSAPSCAAW